MHKHRRKRRPKSGGRPPHLSIPQILAWADDWFARTGRWPKQTSGAIPGSLGENWSKVQNALVFGVRGLPGGSSLPRLLAEQRGVRNEGNLPPFTEEQILAWADEWFQRTGAWPNIDSGAIPGAPGEHWTKVEAALYTGNRGLPGGSSLARLLAEKRGVRNRTSLPALNVRQILAWADEHHQRTGAWPTTNSGEVPGGTETWAKVNTALFEGCRSLPGDSSLARLLNEQRGVRNEGNLPPFTEEQILVWADAHFQRTGCWPKVRSGLIVEAPGETWSAVGAALDLGGRGFPGGDTLARLLKRRRGARCHLGQPNLSEEQILGWADAHHRATGVWPNRASGPIRDAPGQTWSAVNVALQHGHRGLPGGSSLAQLLQSERGVRNIGNLPSLTEEQIVHWARLHRQRTGKWPTEDAGPVLDSPGETWGAITSALQAGLRGLPGGSSLARLLEKRKQTLVRCQG